MSEMLKKNTTLISLNLRCEKKKHGEDEGAKNTKGDRLVGNGVIDEGAKSVSEMLKKNTTLTSLDMSCEEEKKNQEKEQEMKKNN